MSTVYNLEPQPTAKVLLQTSSGDILLELFAKQTPLASRNFLQLCLDGYYNGTIFHRLIPGFILQGGDPTGTGEGGEASYESSVFADEFHSRLKFNRRGLLGMANTARKDDNGSQFFLTLGKTAELDGRNTMFGRVVGDTIYNLMKMGEAELTDAEGSERPLYPTKITGAEILVNPFEDMMARKSTVRIFSQKEEPKKKPKTRSGKALLSFGDDGEEESAEPLLKKPKFNTDLVAPDPSKDDKRSKPAKKATKTKRESPRRSLSPVLSPKLHGHPETQLPLPNDEEPLRSRSSSLPNSPEDKHKGMSVLDRTNVEIAKLKATMKRNTMPKTEHKELEQSALEQMIPVNSTRGRKRNKNNSASETRALKELNAFRARLEKAPPGSKKNDQPKEGEHNRPAEAPPPDEEVDGNDDEEAKLCDLHFIANCHSCQSWDKDGAQNAESGDDGGGTDWMSHVLSFEKDRLGKDLTWKRKNEEELVVIDPREKAKDIKEGQRTKRQGREAHGRAWDRDRDRGRLPERTAGARG